MMTALDFNKDIVVKPRHRLDINAAELLRKNLAHIETNGHKTLVIDMTDVEFIDSAGLGALVTGLKTAYQQGCRLLIYNLQPSVRIVFEITGLDRAFEIVNSLDGPLSQKVKLAA